MSTFRYILSETCNYTISGFYVSDTVKAISRKMYLITCKQTEIFIITHETFHFWWVYCVSVHL